MNRQQQVQAQRFWLARALGVPVEQVTDSHVRSWEQLSASIRGHVQTEAQARGVRAKALSLQVTTRKRETAADRHAAQVARMYGPRQALEGEVG